LPNGTGNIYPVYQSQPSGVDNSAFDGDESTCYDSTVDAPLTDGTNEYAIFKFPAFCSANIPGEIKSVVLKIRCDTSFSSGTPDSTVLVTEVGDGGVTITAGQSPIDPSSGVETFTLTLSDRDEYETSDIKVEWSDGAGSDIRIYEIYFYVEYDDGSTTRESSQVALFARPGSTGSSGVTLGSFGQVTADVTALLTSPEDILEGILAKCGKDDLIDSNSPSSYSTAGTSYSSDNYEVSLVVSQPPDVKALMTRIATQLRSIQFWRNNEHFIKLMGVSYSVDAVISAGDIWQNQAWANYTNKNNVGNDLIGKYNHYWWSNDESDNQDIVTAEDSTSQGVYGTQKESFSLAYIPDETQAQAVLDWRLSELKNPRLIVEFIGTLTNNINRKLGEIVTYDTTDSDLNNLLASLVSSTKKFLIIEIAYQGDGGIRIATIELT